MSKFNYKKLTPFKWYVLENFPFIEADFDALTEWQLFCKLGKVLNTVISSTNSLGTQVQDLTDFVSNYFDNLDVQDEINNKLDEMAESGELAEIIALYINSKGVLSFNTVADMVASDILVAGSTVRTLGLNNYNDGFGRFYKIEQLVSANPDGVNLITLNRDNLYARLINENYITQFNRIDTEINRLSNTTFENPIFPAIKTNQIHAKAVFFDKTNTRLNVIQKTIGGYLMYELDKSNGDTSANSVGLSWDLIRLHKLQKSIHAYVAKNDYDAHEGEITTLMDESNNANDLEVLLFSNGFSTPISGSKKYNKGLKVYGVPANGSLTYNMKTTQNKKANVLFYPTPGSSKNVSISIGDNTVVTNLDLTKYALTGNNPFIFEFDIPQASSLKNYSIKVKNNDASRTMYVSCVNYYTLEEYTGQYVDSFKAILVNEFFINANGASDYAIRDVELNKYCGSFHGGETAISQKLMIPYPDTTNVQYWANNYKYKEVNSINNDLFFLTPYFKIEQVTNINNKANMFSNFDFTYDNIIDMNFFYYNGTIKSNAFFTALTCNDKKFDIVKNPNNVVLTEGEREYLKNNNGLVMFRGNTINSKMNIYYSKFNNNHIEDNFKNGWVEDVSYYNKFYFGVIDEPNHEGTTINNIQFRKIIESLLI